MAALRAVTDRVFYQIPSPARLQRMGDDALEQLFRERCYRFRVVMVVGREIDRRDRAAKAAAAERLRRERTLHQAAMRRRSERADYDLFLHAQFLAAERDCRGVLLTREGAGARVDPLSLFSGPARRAYKWASEELQNWWLGHPRITYAEWKRQSRETYDPTRPAMVAA